MPGESANINLRMNKQMSLKEGQQFTLRGGGATIASGKVRQQIRYEKIFKGIKIFYDQNRSCDGANSIFFFQVTKVNENMTAAEHAYMKANKKQKDKMLAAGKVDKAF